MNTIDGLLGKRVSGKPVSGGADVMGIVVGAYVHYSRTLFLGNNSLRLLIMVPAGWIEEVEVRQAQVVK